MEWKRTTGLSAAVALCALIIGARAGEPSSGGKEQQSAPADVAKAVRELKRLLE